MRNFISGIYKITQLTTGMFYIGSSCDLNLRLYGHRRLLKKNRHHNYFLQKAWNQSNENDFLFEVVEVCGTDSLLKREQHWLDKTKCYQRDTGFNINPKSELGETRSQYWIIIHPCGKTETVLSLTSFCRKFGLSQGNMTEVSLGKRKQHLGFKCRSINTSIEEWEKSTKKRRKENPGSGCVKHWLITKPEEGIIETVNLRKFCEDNHLNYKCMLRVGQGKRKQHKGYKVEFSQ